MAPPLHVTPVACEPGKQRFPKARREDTPEIAKWRCNLTALSQYRNFYFVAFRDEIFVYEPEYPNQRIPSKPAATIKLAKTSSVFGYLDPVLPQGINHLIIRDLGHEEILLLACDGGDVIGYTVRDIEKCLVEHRGAESLPVEPFFCENVGASAWGLDVQKSERMIAVSSNTYNIHVFAFALHHEEPNTDKPREFLDNAPKFQENSLYRTKSRISPKWKAKTKPEDSSRRHELDFAWILEGHESNIPSIAFYNEVCGDPGHVFLVSSDITGCTRLWSVWEGISTPFRISDEMGWGVCCLNRSSARISNTKVETYGCTPKQANGRHESLPYLDNADSLRKIRDNAKRTPPLPITFPSDILGQAQSSMQSMHNIDDDPPAGDFDDPPYDDELLYDSPNDAIGSGDDDPDTAILTGSNRMLNALHRPLPLEAQFETANRVANHILRIWPCNILMCSQKDVVLSSVERKEHSVVRCQGIFNQYHTKFDQPTTVMKQFDRINFVHQIPELGLVIVGTQAGRAAVITMTYFPGVKWYGFKIEAIVPYQSQEDHKTRPKDLMLGMAVSPIQGHQSRAYSPSHSEDNIGMTPLGIERRYRLLLYYYDHTVLSYEIYRSEDDGLLIF